MEDNRFLEGGFKKTRASFGLDSTGRYPIINVYLPVDLLKYFKRIAKHSGVSCSQYFREHISSVENTLEARETEPNFSKWFIKRLLYHMEDYYPEDRMEYDRFFILIGEESS